MPRKKPILVQIESDSTLVRDVESKAIILADKNAYRAHLQKRQKEKEKTAEIEDLKARISRLESLVAALTK